jgi:hypothetical protein
MDTQSKEMLEAILAKSKDSLSTEELGFLMARRSYLNDADTARYADLIKKHEKGELFSTSSEKDLGEMSLKELKAIAKDEEIDITGLKKESDIIDAINEARGEE